MTRVLYGLGHLCVRRRWVVLLLWAALLAVVVGLALRVGSQTADNLTLPGTNSDNATSNLDQRFPSQANGTNPIVVATDKGKLTDSKDRQVIDDAVASLKQTAGVRAVISPFGKAGSANISKDERIAYISVNLQDSPSQLTKDDAERIIAAADPAKEAGLQVAAGGYLGQKVSKPSTDDSEAVGLTAAVIVLLFTFGSVVAMGLPIATALLGLGTGLSLIALLGQVTDVPTIAPTLATMIGLGVGIDYALFIVTRHRSNLKEGMPVAEAAARANATSGGAVVFAGGTVIIALCSLTVAGIPLVTTLGWTAAIAVLVAVLAATTLLPALFGILGEHVNALPIPHLHKRAHEHKPRGWKRWAEGVARHPLPAMLVSLVVLGVLALPVRSLHLGQQDVGALPTDTTARQAYDLITVGFGVGANGPFLISAKVSPPAQPDRPAQKKAADSPASDPRLTKLDDALARQKGVKSVTPPLVNRQGTAAVYTLIPTTAPSDRATEDLVRTLRATTIPDATKGSGVNASVGGTTAAYIDLADRISSKLVLVILVVVGLSFLLLMLAFRSLVIPLEAGLMNLVSVAAAYGVLTAVFQKGWGASLIGLDGPIPIVSFVPLMMFAVLFGLSMDYQVFLLTQVQEHYAESGDNRQAVIDGLAYSARVITSAALIMVSVFASFILNGDPTVKQFGVGLAVAVAVDATIVRCLLVPAVMLLVGRANWWLPGWLAKVLPRIHIEGQGALPPLEGEAQGGGGKAA